MIFTSTDRRPQMCVNDQRRNRVAPLKHVNNTEIIIRFLTAVATDVVVNIKPLSLC